MIDGNKQTSLLGHSIEERICKTILKEAGMQLRATSDYSTDLCWKPKQAMRFELIRRDAYIETCAEQPLSDGTWIIADIEFCAAGYDDRFKTDFPGILPFGCKLSNTTKELIEILGKPELNSFYEDDHSHFAVLAWTKANTYIGVAFNGMHESSTIDCFGVSIKASKIGWGASWDRD